MSIEEEIYSKLVEQFGIGKVCIKKHRDRPSKTWLEFIEAALKLEAPELYTFCGFSDSPNLSGYFKREFYSIWAAKTKSGSYWTTYLTSLIGTKRCSKCKNILSKSLFCNSNSMRDGLDYMCKYCTKEYREDSKEKIKEYYQNNKADYFATTAKRRATKLQATPNWADLEKIKEKYRTCPPGYHVDHEIPLQGKLVCGLHVHENLQHLTAAENLAKSNKFEIN